MGSYKQKQKLNSSTGHNVWLVLKKKKNKNKKNCVGRTQPLLGGKCLLQFGYDKRMDRKMTQQKEH